MIFAGTALARRIEAAEASIARGCAERQLGAAVLEIAGGTVVFQGAASPLSQAVGLGLNGPVRESELSAIEAFFRSRGAPVTIDLCPLADPGFVECMGRRGYRITEFNNVLVKPLAAMETAASPRVRRASADERERWAHTAGHGFFEQSDLTDQEMEVGRAIFSMPGALCYLAESETGASEGAAAMVACGGLAELFADSTVAEFRRRGVHRELIVARLKEAVALGCDVAAASTAPGSGSQRNYERMGFRVAYTKATFVG
ncbi:MAG TPA: hypothetical protein VGF16_00125 [Bryobacteraceae bacterium]|jgi:GNAT superfamily N-acetyltransferase